MRRDIPGVPGLRALAGAAMLVASAAIPAWAQLPKPFYDRVEQRSGLLSRFVPVPGLLPPDPYRDTFYDTRYADGPDTHPEHPNKIKDGGLFGRLWPGYNTASIYPYFYGSPGGNLGPDSRPWHRALKLPQTLVHPFRPVCYYYDQGSYVPIYDLDPLVPGPGPSPYFFPYYLRNPHGG